ncbi:MAG: hypothetical protein HXY41_15810 [Chloroflexi bacterium]|nr:hypothetical protein [Chloroflexota bacterium]
MRGKIRNGWELSKQSWAALRSNPQLVVFPIISMIGMIVVTILFFIPISATGIVSALVNDGGIADNMAAIVSAVVLFIYYLVAYTVTIFSNTALVGAAMKLVRGEPATVSDGIQIAMSRISKIIVYALISATIGMIARSIRESGRRSDNLLVAILTGIIGGLIQGTWNLLVFFAIPVLVVENIGVIDSLKRSLEIFKKTWGEGFVGSTAIGGITCLAYLAVIVIGGVLIFLAVSTGTAALIIGAVALVVLAFIFLGLLQGAVNGVFQASLYNYAQTGDAGRFIDTELARQAFLPA